MVRTSTLILFCSLFSSWALAQTTSSFRYEGILAGPSIGAGAQVESFTVAIERPDGCGPANLGLTPWTNAAVTVTNGAFTLNPQFQSDTFSNVMNPWNTFGGLCPSVPYYQRRLRIVWNGTETFYVNLEDAPRANYSNYSNYATNASGIGGVSVQPSLTCSSGYVLKYSTVNSRFECQALSATDIPTLPSSQITGAFTAAQIPNPAGDISGAFGTVTVDRIKNINVSATAPSNGQILKYNGTAWTPAADDIGTAPGDATYAAKGLIQVNTDQATSGLFLSSGVLAMPNVITAAGPIGNTNTIPVITYDQKGRLTAVTTATVNDNTKLALSGGNLTGALDMSTHDITNVLNLGAMNVEYKDADTNFINLKAPTNISANYTLQLPFDDGVGGQVLTTDGAGILSWTTPSGGGISSLNGQTQTTQNFNNGSSGTVPNWSSAGGLHTLNIPFASTASVTGGLLSNSDYQAFMNKQDSALTNANIWVGNASNVATPRTLSGDATMTNTGVLAVTGIQGRGISATSPVNGSVLVYNGTQWIPTSPSLDTSNIISGTLPVIRGGTGTSTQSANSMIVTDGSGSSMQSFSCANGQVIGFNSGMTQCENVNSANGLARLDFLSDLVLINAQKMYGITAPSVSAPNQGKFYFDSTANKFKVSENGGAFVDLVTVPAPAGANGQIQFNNSGLYGGATALYWNNTNFRLGQGTSSPQEELVVHSTDTTGTAVTISTTGTNASQSSMLNFLTKNNAGATAAALTSTTTKGWQFYAISDIGANPNSFGLDMWDGASWSSAALFFNGSSGASSIKVGIGTSTPAGDLSVAKPDRDVLFNVTNSMTTTTDRYPSSMVSNHMGSSTFLGYPRYVLRSSRGTEALPTSNQINDKLGRISAQSYGTATFADTAAIEFYTTENQTTTARGSAIRFYTVANTTSTLTQRMLIDQDGTVNMSGALTAKSYSTPNWNAGSFTFSFINGGFQTITSDCSASTMTVNGIPDGGRITIVINSTGPCASYIFSGLTVKWKNGAPPSGPAAYTYKYDIIRAGTAALVDWGYYN